MKSKIKRHSRSILAVILTISMLISTMMVGLIATDAARVADDTLIPRVLPPLRFPATTLQLSSN